MVTWRNLLVIVVVAAVSLPMVGQVAAPSTQTISDLPPEDVTRMIDSRDPVQIEEAKKRIAAWLARGRVPKNFRENWIPSLLAQNRIDDALELTLAGVAALPDAKNASMILELRSVAFGAAKKPQEALAAAKSAYNVTELKTTSRSMGRVAIALQAAFPDDKTIANRFYLEQSVASNSRKAEGKGGETAAAPLLKSVTIDSAPYEKALADWKAKDKKFADRLNYGNMLLIADRGTEAEKLFRELLATATDSNQKALATEAIARALRAQDGTLARANAFMTTQAVPGPANPKSPSKSDSSLP
jgi:hypothetical protein